MINLSHEPTHIEVAAIILLMCKDQLLAKICTVTMHNVILRNHHEIGTIWNYLPCISDPVQNQGVSIDWIIFDIFMLSYSMNAKLCFKIAFS